MPKLKVGNLQSSNRKWEIPKTETESGLELSFYYLLSILISEYEKSLFDPAWVIPIMHRLELYRE